MKLKPSTYGDPAAWNEWNRRSKSAARNGGQLVTEAFTRDDYPGTDAGWELLLETDERIRVLRARELPPAPVQHIEPRTSIPALYRSDPPAWLQSHPAFGQATDWAEQWLKTKGRMGLLAIGPVGVGKTGIATWVARLCGEPTHAWYWPVRDLLARIKAEFDTDGNTLGAAKNKPLIVLDDIGTERPTEFNRDVLAELVESRFNAGLATVVTTNLPPKQLREHLGPRAHSRLMESTQELVVTGRDRRLAS